MLARTRAMLGARMRAAVLPTLRRPSDARRPCHDLRCADLCRACDEERPQSGLLPGAREGKGGDAVNLIKLIYLAHPVRGGTNEETARNLKRAREWYSWALAQGVAVAAPYLIECDDGDDSDDAERERGLRRDCEIVRRCDELWLVGGRISPGMARELAVARKHGITVADLTPLGVLSPEIASPTR